MGDVDTEEEPATPGKKGKKAKGAAAKKVEPIKIKLNKKKKKKKTGSVSFFVFAQTSHRSVISCNCKSVPCYWEEHFFC